MKKQPRISEHVNPNLIPMIDIMFLLLLFFMLGADMGHRELESVRLPLSKEAKKDTQQDKEGRLTINANHKEQAPCPEYASKKICRNEAHWELAFRGKDCTQPDALAHALTAAVGNHREAFAQQRVMIRADAGAPYALPQRAMNVCAQQGIFKIEVGAAKPRPQ